MSTEQTKLKGYQRFKPMQEELLKLREENKELKDQLDFSRKRCAGILQQQIELKEQRDELLKRLEETGRMLEGYISGNSTPIDKLIQLQLSANSNTSGKQD